ncbi:MAG: hypothetical protein HYY81_00615 [Deltaproteobacteria bacterium]|nr:hypothetical protein [Deltaproteobacteria bacterium]
MHVEQASRNRGAEPNCWLVAWRVRNLGQRPLQILSGRLPHSRFRACSELPGTIVENAFIILRVLWLEEQWWAFVRLRVTFDELSGPLSITEVITTHKIGFSK